MAFVIRNSNLKSNIKNIPFHLLEQERQRIVLENPDNKDQAWDAYLKSANSWISNYGIKDYSSWLYPQLMALLAEHKLPRNPDTGFIDGIEYWKHNIDLASEWWKGLVRFIKIDPRGLTMKDKQYTSPGRQYCSLVPIVLASHKLYNDVAYGQWDRDTLRAVVNKSLADAMLYDLTEEFSTEEILAIRDIGLTVKSGTRSGQMNKPESTFKMYGIEDSFFKQLPHLVQVMLAQIWCAHPDNRTNLMVLDCKDWDNIPPKLISSGVLKSEGSEPVERSTSSIEENCWD